MKISSNKAETLLNSVNVKSVKTNFTEKISRKEASDIKAQIVENANAITLQYLNVQGNLRTGSRDFIQAYEEFQSFLEDIGYEGASLAELTQEEATALVAEDGMFGVTQTSQRIADFVVNGAGGDEERLRAGREGMLQGFEMAKEFWGGELPEISQRTIEASIEMVDKAMYDLGFTILNQEV